MGLFGTMLSHVCFNFNSKVCCYKYSQVCDDFLLLYNKISVIGTFNNHGIIRTDNTPRAPLVVH